MKNVLVINGSDARYEARAWRDGVLREQASIQVTKMLQAFVPEGFVVKIDECDSVVPGFPNAPNYRFTGMLRDGRIDGSDAHFCVSAYTRSGVQAKLLAVILDGRGFFPLT